MGVSASGATLEIQLVADVARLQRDMAAMKSTVASATASASSSFTGMARSSAVAATQMAAAAQTSARAAVGAASGYNSLGMSAGNARIVSLELFHVTKSLTEQLAMGVSPIRAFTSEIGRIGTAVQYSGGNITALIGHFARMVGIIKVTQDAELAETAAMTAASARSIKAIAERAAATVVSRQAQVALAQAEVEGAASAELQEAAQARLVRALRSVEGAAGKAAVANRALATAEAEAAGAAEAAAAAETVALGPIVAVVAAVAAAAGLAFGAFKQFQSQVKDSGELTSYRDNLGLTHKEMLQLGEGVDKVNGKIKELGGVTVTLGDVMAGLWKTIADNAETSGATKVWGKIASLAVSAFNWILSAWNVVSAGISASIDYMIDHAKGAWGALKALKSGATLAQADAIAAAAPSLSEEYKKELAANNKFWSDVEKNAKQHRKGIMDAEAAALIADRTPKKAKKQSDHGLADALAELDAQIKGQYALAAAYQVSDAAAIKAEALQKAEEQAIRHKGNVGIFYEKELALAIATGAAQGAKVYADLTEEAGARAAVNDQIKQGLIPASQATEALELEAKLRPLAARASLVEGDAKERLVGIMRNLTNEFYKNNAEREHLQVLADLARGTDQLDKLQLEISLIGESNRVRAVAIAQLEAENYLRDHPGASADEAQRYIDQQKDIARLTEDLATGQTNYNNTLSYTANLLGLINEQAQATASSLSDAFGSVGAGVGQALTALTGYAATQAKLDEDHRAALKAAGKDAAAAAKIDILYAKQSATAKTQATMQAIGGLKSLFKEHSAGYKVMSAIEKAYALFQAAETIASIVRDATKTASSLANSAVRTTANTAEGASKIFAELGPWAFPVVAAMVAVLAALGARGGGGGSGSPPIPTAQDLQDQAGTGTVLGDSKGKSASIANSLEIVAANTNKDLEYSDAMLSALRNIDLGISKMAGTIAKQIQVSGSLFDTSKLKLGTTGSSGFLGLFGSSTTKSLFDLGIKLNSASVASIIANGISGSTYQIVEKIKKSNGFLGIGGGTATSYTTTSGNLDPQISSAVQSVIMSLRDGLVSAANVIGLDGAQAMLDGFQIKLGKISFKDMTGKEIEDQLNAIFSSIGDQMAGAILPALKDMQKVGEGLFETFIRVAKEYEVVDTELKSIGKTFGAVGINSVAARDALVQLFGGLDDFISATDTFRDKFLSDAEQIAPVQAAVLAELARLGVANVTTREQFKDLVLGLDLTTDAGRQMYASLLAVAPAFDKVLGYFDDLNKATITSLQSTIDQFKKFADSLKQYRATLFSTDQAQGSAYAALKAKFAATAQLASAGDATALGGLESTGKDFLTAARNNASSMQQYLRDVALVARGVDQGILAATATADYAQLQLDALQNATTILGTIAQNTAATALALSAPSVNGASAASAIAPVSQIARPADAVSSPELITEIELLRADLNAALQAIASSTGSTDKTLKRWDRGDSAAISTDADTEVGVSLKSWG